MSGRLEGGCGRGRGKSQGKGYEEWIEMEMGEGEMYI